VWGPSLLAVFIFLIMTTPKDAKTKKDFHGVSRNFCTFKVPTKPDGGKPS